MGQLLLDSFRINNILSLHYKFITIVCNLKQQKSQVKKKKSSLIRLKPKKKNPAVETHSKRCEHRPRISTLQLQPYQKLPVRLSANCPNCSKATAVGRLYNSTAKETKW